MLNSFFVFGVLWKSNDNQWSISVRVPAKQITHQLAKLMPSSLDEMSPADGTGSLPFSAAHLQLSRWGCSYVASFPSAVPLDRHQHTLQGFERLPSRHRWTSIADRMSDAQLASSHTPCLVTTSLSARLHYRDLLMWHHWCRHGTHIASK